MFNPPTPISFTTEATDLTLFSRFPVTTAIPSSSRDRTFQEHEKRVSSQEFWWTRTIFLCLSHHAFFRAQYQRVRTCKGFSLFWEMCWRSTLCLHREPRSTEPRESERLPWCWRRGNNAGENIFDDDQVDSGAVSTTPPKSDQRSDPEQAPKRPGSGHRWKQKTEESGQTAEFQLPSEVSTGFSCSDSTSVTTALVWQVLDDKLHDQSPCLEDRDLFSVMTFLDFWEQVLPTTKHDLKSSKEIWLSSDTNHWPSKCRDVSPTPVHAKNNNSKHSDQGHKWRLSSWWLSAYQSYIQDLPCLSWVKRTGMPTSYL